MSMVEWKKLGEVLSVLRGMRLIKNQLDVDAKYPVFHGGIEPLGNYTEYNREANSVMIINVGASAGTIGFSDRRFWSSDGCFCLSHSEDINQKYLYHYLSTRSRFLRSQVRVAGIPTLDRMVIEKLDFPYIPLSEQSRIVGILDTFTASIANLKEQIGERRKQYEHYRDQLLDLEGKEGVEMKMLPQISQNLDKYRKPLTSSKRIKGEYPYYGASGIVDYVEGYLFDGCFLLISEDGANLLARTSPIAFEADGKIWVNNHAHVLSFESRITQRLVEIYLNKIDLSPWINGAAQPKLNQENLNKIEIPIPSLEEQSRIVSILDQFEASIANLEAQLQEREKQYEHYREKLLTFE